MSPAPSPQPAADPEHLNSVVVVGRVAAPATTRVLPSGDEIALLRVVVDRPPSRRRSDDRPAPRVDTFDIACWTARLRARAATLEPGDTARVEGALRRRFYRTPGGPMSRYEIEASAVRRERRVAS